MSVFFALIAVCVFMFYISQRINDNNVVVVFYFHYYQSREIIFWPNVICMAFPVLNIAAEKLGIERVQACTR